MRSSAHGRSGFGDSKGSRPARSFSILFLLSITLVTGCHFIVPVYFVNERDEYVDVTLHLRGNWYTSEGEERQYGRGRSAGRVLDVQDDVFDLLTDTVAFTVVDSNTVTFRMPPTSTVYLGKAANTSRLNIRSIEVRHGETVEILDHDAFLHCRSLKGIEQVCSTTLYAVRLKGTDNWSTQGN